MKWLEILLSTLLATLSSTFPQVLKYVPNYSLVAIIHPSINIQNVKNKNRGKITTAKKVFSSNFW